MDLIVTIIPYLDLHVNVRSLNYLSLKIKLLINNDIDTNHILTFFGLKNISNFDLIYFSS